MHHEIMSELRAIPCPDGGFRRRKSVASGNDLARRLTPRDRPKPLALLETTRAQSSNAEKIKVETSPDSRCLQVRTKREIAVLHGKSFNGEGNGQGLGEARSRTGSCNRRSHPAKFLGSRRWRSINAAERAVQG